MGKVMFSVCPHLGGGGGVPISHNALQHFPECHGAATGGGGYPARSSQGGYPAGGVPCQGGTLLGGSSQVRYPPSQVQPGGYPARGGTLPGGYPAGGGEYPGQVPPPARSSRGGTLGGSQVPPLARSGWGGGTQLGQHREYLLHGGRYASCVHARGLSCLSSTSSVKSTIGNHATYF